MTATTEERLGSGQMFDQIAPRYDLLNRLISLGLDRRWRTRLVRSLAPTAPRRLLDVATGTADVLQALRRAYPEAEVYGLDPSGEMLRYGRGKLDARSFLVRGDGQQLPFADDSFDGCTISFGIRNVPDADACLANLFELLAPGGTICFHEYSVADSAVSRALWNFVAGAIIIPAGVLTSPGSPIYRYLRRSVVDFDGVRAFEERLRRAGFADVRTKPMDGWQRGIVHSFLAERPR